MHVAIFFCFFFLGVRGRPWAMWGWLLVWRLSPFFLSVFFFFCFIFFFFMFFFFLFLFLFLFLFSFSRIRLGKGSEGKGREERVKGRGTGEGGGREEGEGGGKEGGGEEGREREGGWEGERGRREGVGEEGEKGRGERGGRKGEGENWGEREKGEGERGRGGEGGGRGRERGEGGVSQWVSEWVSQWVSGVCPPPPNSGFAGVNFGGSRFFGKRRFFLGGRYFFSGERVLFFERQRFVSGSGYGGIFRVGVTFTRDEVRRCFGPEEWGPRSVGPRPEEWPRTWKDGAQRVTARRLGCGSVGVEGWRPKSVGPKISRCCYPSPDQHVPCFFSLSESSRGIADDVWSIRPSKMHVWSSVNHFERVPAVQSDLVVWNSQDGSEGPNVYFLRERKGKQRKMNGSAKDDPGKEREETNPRGGEVLHQWTFVKEGTRKDGPEMDDSDKSRETEISTLILEPRSLHKNEVWITENTARSPNKVNAKISTRRRATWVGRHSSFFGDPRLLRVSQKKSRVFLQKARKIYRKYNNHKRISIRSRSFFFISFRWRIGLLCTELTELAFRSWTTRTLVSPTTFSMIFTQDRELNADECHLSWIRGSEFCRQ